jgi:UDP-N-acetylmuramoyl-tripeptide--D-alanyl-D-alanine ligase
MEIKDLHSLFLDSSGVCTDTRKVKPNSIFFALKGDNFNGNKFADQAIEKGCSCAVVDQKSVIENSRYDQNQFILVDDVLLTLQKLANHHRNHLNTKVIGLTGSNGKTTTKELLQAVLSKKFKTFATPGNFNNHIGLPLTILQTPHDTELLILEMGDNQPGDIDELCEVSDPDYGIITNIGKDHIEGFGSMEGNVKSKKELFDYLSKRDRTCFYNGKNEYSSQLIEGISNTADFSAENSLSIKEQNPFISYKSEDGNVYQSKLIGAYNIDNINCAYRIGKFFGISDDNIHEAITRYTPSNNRSQFIETNGGNQIFLDAYNANPTSVEKALKSFSEMRSNREKWVFLGDMLELGSISKDEHRNILSLLKELNFKNVVLVGQAFHEFEDEFSFSFFDKKEKTMEFAQNQKLKNALILLKGSRGLKMEEFTDVIP